MKEITEALVFCLKQKAHYDKHPPEDQSLVVHLDHVIARLKRVINEGAV